VRADWGVLRVRTGYRTYVGATRSPCFVLRGKRAARPLLSDVELYDQEWFGAALHDQLIPWILLCILRTTSWIPISVIEKLIDEASLVNNPLQRSNTRTRL
jgi:hypothetical protein